MIARRCPVIFGLLLALGSGLYGCSNWSEYAGVENVWRSASIPEWQPGETKADDVIDALGPPSQLINLQSQSVYYYMREHVSGKGYYLLFYNQSRKTTRYDRAVFFFDENGVLERYAYSKEALPSEP